jgi:hypothetical protein
MAVAGINLSIDTAELHQLQKALGKVFDNKGLAAILEEALEKAIWPAYLRLREVTPDGPTGNLKRAVAYKTKAYPKNGGAVGLIGYNRTGRADSSSAAGGAVQAGPDRAFHQWWLEYGTKPREIATFSNTPYQRKAHTRRMKSGKVATVQQHQVSGQNAYIASSYNKLGPYKILPTPRIRGQAQRVQTDPAYPRAFLKKSKTPITIPAMPAGGTAGRPPVQTAWNNTKGQVAEILQRELALSLEQALSKLTYSSTGSVDSGTIGA